MERVLVKHVLASSGPRDQVRVLGWVRTRRDGKGISFLEVNDGSCLTSLQVVVEPGVEGSDHLPQLTTGAALEASGPLVASPAKGQAWELRANSLRLIGPADATYPLQKKGHSLEFLRTIAHLRPRLREH